MKRQIIIVAGGKGQRMGLETPKQFLIIGGKPLLMHTIERIYQWNNMIKIIVVLPIDNIEHWFTLCKEYNFNIHHTIVEGGSTRWESVRNGLAFTDDEGVIGVHDGVRPVIDKDLLERSFAEAEINNTAIPCIAVTDSLREITKDGSKMVNRTHYVAIQTPQVFNAAILKKVYSLPYNESFTDDASVVEWYGYKINIVGGNYDNIKVTTPKDIIIAEHILGKKS